MAYEKLQRLVDESSRIAFFGGAGVSTESGIPDFRSVDGLYNQSYDYPPEQILSQRLHRLVQVVYIIFFVFQEPFPVVVHPDAPQKIHSLRRKAFKHNLSPFNGQRKAAA